MANVGEPQFFKKILSNPEYLFRNVEEIKKYIYILNKHETMWCASQAFF